MDPLLESSESESVISTGGDGGGGGDSGYGSGIAIICLVASSNATRRCRLYEAVCHIRTPSPTCLPLPGTPRPLPPCALPPRPRHSVFPLRLSSASSLAPFFLCLEEIIGLLISIRSRNIPSTMSKAELVFIPAPGLSHLLSTVEAAKLLLSRNHRLAITVIVIHLPASGKILDDNYKRNLSSITKPTPQLKFIDLEPNDPSLIPAPSPTFQFEYINNQIDRIRQIVSKLIDQPSFPGVRPAGLVLDMFCTKFVQVADEFGIPSYMFYTGGAYSFGSTYLIVSLKFEQNQDLSQYNNSEVEFTVPCFAQPFPAKVFPSLFVDGSAVGEIILDCFKRMYRTRGILINTFRELEPYAIESLLSKYRNMPKVYPVGPILHLKGASADSQLENEVMTWLDKQPENSVVFLCFGTMGTFDVAQVKEIAKALENCGSRFLWSLRKREQKGTIQSPVEFDSYGEVLPEGFLERTKEVGKVIGWAPQVAVLAHAAVGGFVSHCGWNSTLESLWFGVPMAAFPMYAEQQTNAFTLVKELGIAEAIRIDYKANIMGETVEEVVPAEEIEAAIRRLMAAGEGGVRGRVKELQRKSREALEEGGSSYMSQIEFIKDVFSNVGLE